MAISFFADVEMAELQSDTVCSICGAETQVPEFDGNKHGENICGHGTYSCAVCTKTFSLWTQYDAHKKSHQKMKQRQYPCQTCGKVIVHQGFIEIRTENLPPLLHGVA